jgi:uracil-DNA glycosylase
MVSDDVAEQLSKIPDVGILLDCLYIRRGVHLGSAPVRSGCRPALLRVWFALVTTGRSAGRSVGHRTGTNALGQDAFTHWMIAEPKSSHGFRNTVVECCRRARSLVVVSIHLLESLDKIRLPTGRKHGFAIQRRPPWPSSFMYSSGKSFDQGESSASREMRMRARQESRSETLAALLAKVRACSACASALPLGPRPILQLSTSASILIASQAPGSKVHQTGVPFSDVSGDRLREWMGLSTDEFYDEKTVAIMPMGFCYPGRLGGGDAPPRAECVHLWRNQLLQLLPAVRLTLLVGSYAQQHVLGPGAITPRVKNFRDYLPDYFPLPHPSWRSRIWEEKNSWFREDVLPALRSAIERARAGDQERNSARLK